MRTSGPLFCVQNQRFGCRRSRCDYTFKGNGEPVETQRQNDFKLVCIYIYDLPYDSNPLENSGFTSRIFPWLSTPGLMSNTARRRDTIRYKELSLRCLPGHILGNHERVYSKKCWVYRPASKPKYSGVRVPHIGIELSVLQIPFRLEYHGVIKHFRVVHHRPK